MERNEPCPCGSGNKYKKCCGSPAQGAAADAAINKPVLKAGMCNFECAIDCAASCCGGATMITIDEIKRLYHDFPITVGFRKYAPLDENHEVFLEAIGLRSRGEFIVGDFVAGNWRNRRCTMLGDDNLCRLHKEGRKPAQCSLVPFCAVYPEERQDAVFMEQSRSAFSRCRGFRSADERSCEVWKSGKFTDERYAAAFAGYRSSLLRQKPFMMKMLKDLKKQSVFSSFLRGKGILEAAVPADMLIDLFDAAGIPEEDRGDFVAAQLELCRRELQSAEKRIEVYRDCVVAYERQTRRP